MKRNRALSEALSVIEDVGILYRHELASCIADERRWRRVSRNIAHRFAIPVRAVVAARLLSLAASFAGGEDAAWAIEGSVFALNAARIARRAMRHPASMTALYHACLLSLPWIRNYGRDAWEDVTNHERKDEG